MIYHYVNDMVIYFRGDVVLCRSVQNPRELIIKRVTAMEGDLMPETIEPINKYLRHSYHYRVNNKSLTSNEYVTHLRLCNAYQVCARVRACVCVCACM